MEAHKHSFNPLTVKNPEMIDDLNNIQIGGFGVYIVKELMDDICYRRFRKITRGSE